MVGTKAALLGYKASYCIVLVLPTQVLCSVAASPCLEICILVTEKPLPGVSSMAVLCGLTYNLKLNSIIVFTTDTDLYRFSKSIMTDCRRPSLQLLSSTTGDPALLM